MSKPLIILGAGGHAAVLAELIDILQLPVLGFTDVHEPGSDSMLGELCFLGDDASVLSTHNADEVLLVNGLGSTGEIKRRAVLFDRFSSEGYGFTDVFHPTSYLSPSASYSQGLQLLAGAIINTGVQVGANVLINSRALVEHHSVVGDHCHIASGAVVCGECRIGHSVHIGAGAVINQGISIGNGAIIASGAVVIADVPAGGLMAGVPAQQKR